MSEYHHPSAVVDDSDDLVYVIVMDDPIFDLRVQLRVYKTWEAADRQARETARDQRKACWVMGFPNPKAETTIGAFKYA